MAQEFIALGHAGSDAYGGLETFPNPGVAAVELESDELTAMCPITNQPDFYAATIRYRPKALCLESKSLKIYLSRFRDRVRSARRSPSGSATTSPLRSSSSRPRWTVTLVQKRRGGISITASV